TQEIECFDEGILRLMPGGPNAGDVVKVGQVLGHLVVESEVIPADADDGAAIASPRARRRAVELGVDWRRLTGTGRAGRIRERDVLAASAVHTDAIRPPMSAQSVVRSHSVTRRTIAARMVSSHLTTAPVTLTGSADASNLVNLREQFRVSSAHA